MLVSGSSASYSMTPLISDTERMVASLLVVSMRMSRSLVVSGYLVACSFMKVFLFATSSSVSADSRIIFLAALMSILSVVVIMDEIPFGGVVVVVSWGVTFIFSLIVVSKVVASCASLVVNSFSVRVVVSLIGVAAQTSWQLSYSHGS